MTPRRSWRYLQQVGFAPSVIDWSYTGYSLSWGRRGLIPTDIRLKDDWRSR